jgi:hypothetical protein
VPVLLSWLVACEGGPIDDGGALGITCPFDPDDAGPLAAAPFDGTFAGEVTWEASVIADGDGVVVDDGVVTITAPGAFRLRGDGAGRVVVTVPDGAVTLVLDGLALASADGAPIAVEAGDDVDVVLVPGTTNTLVDDRTTQPADGATAALFSTGDLHLRGGGALVVETRVTDGIGSRDDQIGRAHV